VLRAFGDQQEGGGMSEYTLDIPNITRTMKSMINGWNMHHTGETRSVHNFSAKSLKRRDQSKNAYIDRRLH
jgi:hypothetical protein